MEAGELAEAAAIILGFHAPALVSAGDGASNGDGRPPEGQDEAAAIWAALEPAGEPDMYEAVRAVAQEPCEATMGALRARLGELFGGNPYLARRIEELIAQGSYASLVGQAANDGYLAAVSGDFRELARLRRAFMILFVGAALLSGGALSILSASFIWIGLFFIIQGMRASVAWYYGQRLRLPGAAWLGMATFIPGSFWPVFFTIRGWRPAALSTPISGGGRLESWVKGWMAVYASLSLLAFVFAIVTHVSYFVRVLASPLGLFLYAVWMMLYLPGVFLLYQFYWKGQGRSGWQFGGVSALLGMSNVLAAFIGLIGPALLLTYDVVR
jgi:hypothetical protein